MNKAKITARRRYLIGAIAEDAVRVSRINRRRKKNFEVLVFSDFLPMSYRRAWGRRKGNKALTAEIVAKAASAANLREERRPK